MKQFQIDPLLPIAAVAKDVCNALRDGNVVLQAEPGAGKSTGLPLELLNAGYDGKIIMLEPRRLAAQNVASRLASQINEPLGKTIGLRMRGRTDVSKSTRIEVVTEGVLTRILQNDPLLEGISLIVFDEFHERSLHADLGLALCLDSQRGVREDLRLLFMSATLETESLCKHVDVNQPIVCKVRQHPVDIFWRGDSRLPLPQAVAQTVLEALTDHKGDVLAFLPGVAEIERTARILEEQVSASVKIHKLHSGVSADAQRAATAAKQSKDKRRVIVATSIAETSITIDGVSIVVDSGVERRSRIDLSSGIERLETVMASQASATQRAGRAGRTEAGVCYRLWSESGHHTRAASWQPEIYRADLSSVVLEAGQWGVTDIASLPWIDAPPQAAINRAKALLQRMGIWGNEGLTEYGRAVAKLPLSPRLGHMLFWGAKHGALDDAAKLAALLEELPRSKEADFASSLRRLSKWQSRRARQLSDSVSATGVDIHSESSKPSAAILLARAYPDRIAKRRSGADGRYILSGGSGAVLATDDLLSQSNFLVIAAIGGGSKENRIYSALATTEPELSQWCDDLIEMHDAVEWDDTNERVVAEKQKSLGTIVLGSKPLTNIDNELRSAALLSAVRKKGLQCLDWNKEVREWLARVTRISKLIGAESDFPQVDDESLLSNLEEWLAPYLNKTSSLKAVKQINLLPILKALLNYAQQQQLDEWLPQSYTVPSGSKPRLRYDCDGNPVLSVKLQEMFGCRENPSVANGRITLKVELLSPARRPVQITEDLANFWSNSYPAVKKDLAGRYPKHPWPEDPLNATATAYAKPRKR